MSIMMMVIYDCSGNSDDDDVTDYGDNDINNSYSNDHEVWS